MDKHNSKTVSLLPLTKENEFDSFGKIDQKPDCILPNTTTLQIERSFDSSAEGVAPCTCRSGYFIHVYSKSLFTSLFFSKWSSTRDFGAHHSGEYQ